MTEIQLEAINLFGRKDLTEGYIPHLEDLFRVAEEKGLKYL